MHNERDAGEVVGYAEAEALLRDIIGPSRISDTTIRVARDHMMQFARSATRPPAPEDAGTVERVARAICEVNVEYTGPNDAQTLDERVFEEWNDWEPSARAALAALSRLDGEMGAP
ncbi:hypothetical protein GCM10008023_06170 [Sphingomonas glacialis]|uniref:Uncharacterized protein n=1 Tax=Sphingomonas glacialis TaxID=658225 RepID=A0ABQ3L9F9_9SPHN|nr:hypothetical protein GCM10008023_06170 [Sphingomonas glacialis]